MYIILYRLQSGIYYIVVNGIKVGHSSTLLIGGYRLLFLLVFDDTEELIFDMQRKPSLSYLSKANLSPNLWVVSRRAIHQNCKYRLC